MLMSKSIFAMLFTKLTYPLITLNFHLTSYKNWAKIITFNSVLLCLHTIIFRFKSPAFNKANC